MLTLRRQVKGSTPHTRTNRDSSLWRLETEPKASFVMHVSSRWLPQGSDAVVLAYKKHL